MPGLLGLVDGRDKLGPDRIGEILNSMGQALYSESDYVTESAAGERFGVALVARPQVTDFTSADPDGRGRVFLSGEFYSLCGEDRLGDQIGPTLTTKLLDNGERTLATSDGSFSLAWFDKSAGTFTLATDVVASHPLYIAEQDGVLYFAPEMKALLPLLDSLEVNRAAIAHFLVEGMPYLEETFFSSIRQLPPGSLLQVNLHGGESSEKKYWSYSFDENPRDLGVARFSAELNELLDRSVRRRVRDQSSRRLALSLSGGFDSRAILGACLKQKVDFITVTHGVQTDKPATDMVLAEQLASRYGLRHLNFPYNPAGMIEHLDQMIHLSDGMNDQLDNYPEGLSIIHKTRREADVLLRGDEAFGWKGGVFNQEDALACFGPTRLPEQYGEVMPPRVYEEMQAHAEAGLKMLIDACPQKRLIDLKDSVVFNQGMPNFWSKLTYLKRAAIDIRTPLLDREVMEFVSRLPYRHRMYRSLFRRSCLRGHRELFSLPMAQSHNLANWSDIYRREGRLTGFLEDKLLTDPHPFFRDLVDADRIRHLIHKVNMRQSESPSTSPSAKAYQGLSVLGRLRAFKPKALLAQGISSNPHLYRLAMPLLKNKRVKIGWFKDDDMLLRLIIVKRWSDMFLR